MGEGEDKHPDLTAPRKRAHAGMPARERRYDGGGKAEVLARAVAMADLRVARPGSSLGGLGCWRVARQLKRAAFELGIDESGFSNRDGTAECDLNGFCQCVGFNSSNCPEFGYSAHSGAFFDINGATVSGTDDLPYAPNPTDTDGTRLFRYTP